MATGGPSESLLTRDAGTIAEYICLMSDEAHAEDRNSASSKRWKQVRVGVFRSRPILWARERVAMEPGQVWGVFSLARKTNLAHERVTIKPFVVCVLAQARSHLMKTRRRR